MAEGTAEIQVVEKKLDEEDEKEEADQKAEEKKGSYLSFKNRIA